MGFKELQAEMDWEYAGFGKIFFINTFRKNYRLGEPAEIIGVQMVKIRNIKNKKIIMHEPCFIIRYKDGTEDLVPIGESCVEDGRKFYEELITEEDVKQNKLPPLDPDYPFINEDRLFGPGALGR